METFASQDPVVPPAPLSAEQIERVLGNDARSQRWLETVRDVRLEGRIPLARAYAAAARALSNLAVTAPWPAVQGNAVDWSWLDWGRLWLLQRALQQVPAADGNALVLALFEQGEQGEQESLLRTIAYLPDAARFTDLGVEACRANATGVFAALALDNPFAATQFDALAFNQMVIKAVFMELPLARVLGLAARHSPELARMAEALASERRAAGRPIPVDLALLISASAELSPSVQRVGSASGSRALAELDNSET